MTEEARNDRPGWLAMLALTIVGVAAGIGVGVAVSGMPDDDTASTAPAVSTVPIPDTSDTSDTVDTTVAPTTEPTDPATSDVATTEAPSTDPGTTDPGSTDTTAPEATAAPTTAAPTTEAPDPLPGRDEIRVVVANGNGVAGAAAFTADLLRLEGYTQVSVANGTELFGQTVVYHDEENGAAAIRLVDDLELGDIFVVPIAEAPPTNPPSAPPDGDAQVLVYLGAS